MFGLLGYFTSPLGLLSLALLVGCVVHAIKRGNIFPWIYVIVFLPGIGSLIYLAMEILPELFGSRHARKIGAGVQTLADPNRSMREALRQAEMTGSVDARRNLAEQYLARGQSAEAVALYKGMLDGQFRDDPVLWLGLARAQYAAGDAAAAQTSLDELQRVDPKFQSSDAHLLYARALEDQAKNDEALEEYRKLVRYFPGEEARCRLAMLLDRMGRRDEAHALFEQVAKNLDGAPRRYRQAQKEWGDIAKAALR